MLDFVKSALLYPLPHHLISRVILHLTRRRSGHRPFIRWFIRQFDVDMQDAIYPDADSYPSFNAFFTRALKPGARPLDAHTDQWLCPSDGTVSALGRITAGRLFQAKGHDYSLHALLGGDDALAGRFSHGSFITIYLSPRDYHRIHLPATGRLQQEIHVPGRLFSVAAHTVRTIPGLFARNERVIAVFETGFGPLAVILVGAINVAAIETVWSGLVTPPQRRTVGRKSFEDQPIDLNRGDEIGRFNMGSTVIMLTGRPTRWEASLATGTTVRMGQALGTLLETD